MRSACILWGNENSCFVDINSHVVISMCMKRIKFPFNFIKLTEKVYFILVCLYSQNENRSDAEHVLLDFGVE